MPISSTERPRTRLLPALFAFLAATLSATPAPAQISTTGPFRLLEVIEVSDHDDQADITMAFACSMRFVANVPASEGKEVRIQLAPLPDCRLSPLSQIPSELPPVSGGGNILESARLESLAPGQVTVTLLFKKSERFVIAQGVDQHTLRLRLIDRARGRGKVLIGSTAPEAVSNFAINLESQPKPFEPADIERAHERLKAPAFVSEVMVDGDKWYRLRVGPINRRSEADRLLNLALPDYPRAWLAIGDDEVTSDANTTPAQLGLPAVQKPGSDAPLPPAELKKTLSAARSALSAHDYPEAIKLLTKLQRQPEFPDRSKAQELLGLARERAGQFAHAKAEYQEYLRLYPQGEAAERVAFRLKALRAAEAKARTGRDVSGEQRGWSINAGFSQTARYDGTRIKSGAPPPNTQAIPDPNALSSNSLFTDGDLFARRRGETYDFLGRVSAGYGKTFSAGTGSSSRVSLASVELLDRPLGLLGRVGRQISNNNGLLGAFDGALVSWQATPAWAVQAAAGYPVEQLSLAPKTNERFETMALAYTPPNQHWDASVFVVEQTFDGLRDRRAVGLNGRYLNSWGSLVGVLDYDVGFKSLNTASLLGTMQLPSRWTLSLDAERRNSPVLTSRNALIGQSVSDLNALLAQVGSAEQIYFLARARTPITDDYSVTASRPIGQRYQFTSIVSASRTGPTQTVGAVQGDPASGWLLTYQAQFAATNFWTQGDFNVITLTDSKTLAGRLDSVALTSRFPITKSWRMGPRLSIDRLAQDTNSSNELTFLPSMLLDWQRNNKLLQIDFGGELGRRLATIQIQNGQFVQSQNLTRYYVSVSYRINFTK